MRDDVRGWLVEHLGDQGRRWSSTRAATSSTAPPRSGCSAGTPAPPGGWRTPRSWSCWCTPAMPATGSSTGSCTCQRAGPIRRAAGRRVSPTRWGLRPSPSLPPSLLRRALDAGVPARWVTGDEVYGASVTLWGELEARQIGYVLAVACHHRVCFGGATCRVDELLAKVPARAWQCVSAGAGAKGHRLYDWCLCVWTTTVPLPAIRRGGAGCWSAATAPAASWPSTAALRPARPRWPCWSRSPAGVGRWRCVNRGALIYANGLLHDLGSRCGRVALSRPSAGGCTSRAGECGAGEARELAAVGVDDPAVGAAGFLARVDPAAADPGVQGDGWHA
jgi:hypothetical protein